MPVTRPARPTYHSTALAAAALLILVFSTGSGASEPPPESAEVLLRRAYHAQHTGKDEAATGYYKRYFEQGPESAHARVEFSRVLSRSGKHGEAVEQARRASKIKPDDPEIIVNLARVLRKARLQPQALVLLEKANAKFQDNGEIEFYLGEVLHDLGRKGRARVHYNQVLFHRESIGWKASIYRNIALWRLANLNHQAGNLHNARIFAAKYLSYNPSRIFVRYFLGYHLYYRENDFDRARREFEIILTEPTKRADQEGVNLAEVYGALGAIYFLEDDHRCMRLLRASIKRKKHGILEKGLLYAYKKRDDQALQYLIPYVKANQQHLIARVAVLRIMARMNRPDLLGDELGRVSLLAGKLSQNRIGLEVTRQAFELLEQDPDRAEISRSRLNQQMARHYHALGQPRRTIVYMRRAIEAGDREKRWKDPEERADMHLGLARVLAERKVGRAREGIELCNEVLGRHPELHMAYFTRGLIHLKNQDYSSSIQDISTAIEKTPAESQRDLISYHYYRAVARHELTTRGESQFEATVADLKRVLELNADFAEANNFLGYIYAERGINLEEARRYIERAVKREPTRGNYQDSLGWLFFKTGEFRRARYHLQLAAMLKEESGDADPVVYDHLGDVWLKLEYPRRAILAYNRALALLETRIKNEERTRSDRDRDRKLALEIQKKIKELNS